ncbi:MAG: hypothetical protein PUD38_01850 [Firmicutes bacterium]|nr:hypothetical protein [Bacillota bacterium]
MAEARKNRPVTVSFVFEKSGMISVMPLLPFLVVEMNLNDMRPVTRKDALQGSACLWRHAAGHAIENPEKSTKKERPKPLKTANTH